MGVTVRDGGTLVFDPENDSTTLLQLEVWGGTVELYGGRILRKGLQLNNSIVLGDLLPRKAGLAYYREGSDTQLTLKEAASTMVRAVACGGDLPTYKQPLMQIETVARLFSCWPM